MFQGRNHSLLLLIALFPGAGLASAEFPSPRLHENSLELRNTATVDSYNRSHKQSDWVFYALGQAQLKSCYERANSFKADPRLSAADSAQLVDYSGSGYDRGHLSPAGDNKWSKAAMDESFFLSNVSPQPGGFNRGIWSKLEGLVRAWARNFAGGLWVTTGPVLSNKLRTIGPNRVSVPEYFYKVLSTTTGNRHSTIAFLLPVTASGDLSKYEMTVKELEGITGLDFLNGLSDEDTAESSMDSSLWKMNANFSYFPCKAVSPASLDWSWGIAVD